MLERTGAHGASLLSKHETTLGLRLNMMTMMRTIAGFAALALARIRLWLLLNVWRGSRTLARAGACAACFLSMREHNLG